MTEYALDGGILLIISEENPTQQTGFRVEDPFHPTRFSTNQKMLPVTAKKSIVFRLATKQEAQEWSKLSSFDKTNCTILLCDSWCSTPKETIIKGSFFEWVYNKNHNSCGFVLTHTPEKEILEARDIYSGVIAGYIHYLKENGNVIYIEELFVNPTYRRKGVGTKLINFFSNNFIKLHVYTDNKIAESFYNSVGFKLMNSKDISGRTALLMCRKPRKPL